MPADDMRSQEPKESFAIVMISVSRNSAALPQEG